ncbi:hypothetical protein Bhyg_15378, partial [Pseudolycoriella hygida]
LSAGYRGKFKQPTARKLLQEWKIRLQQQEAKNICKFVRRVTRKRKEQPDKRFKVHRKCDKSNFVFGRIR